MPWNSWNRYLGRGHWDGQLFIAQEKIEKVCYHSFLLGGIPTPVKNDGVKVSRDDEIPMIIPDIRKNNPAMFQTTSQFW